ncbi:MAG: bifunctional methylenetetrahydrofolate dehydrogenase/methenyltetrahydrofolate cyclohydrolase FolD [Myxococcales bacterium]
MTATIIDGKAIAAKVRSEAATAVQAFRQAHGRAPGLHVVLAGEDPGSTVYVRNKEKDALEAGFAGVVHRLPATISEQSLLGLIGELNQDPNVDGILVQLPLPKGLRSQLILDAVDPAKDVDGFHPVNVGALWSGLPGLVPCTPRGCIRMLDESKIEIAGKRALVVGRSNIVGKPMAALLLGRHATVTMAHSKTQDLPTRCREADILVAAIGQAKMIKADWIKPGAVVIDVGMNVDENGKLCGDVDTKAAMEVASAITPVPGGVGPMTRAMLLDNTLSAAKARLAH